MATVTASSRQRSRVTLHGRELAYYHFEGEGRPLVLLHGVGSSADGWQAAATALAERGAHVISVDLPGHGDSSKQPGDYSLGSLASAVRDLLDLLEIPQAILVGHSLGGGVALQFRYQFPTHVAGLVLVSSGGLGPDANMILRLASLPGAGVVMKVGLNQRTLKVVDSFRRGVRRWGGPSDFIPDHALARLDRLAGPEGRNSFLATLRSVVDFSGQRVSAIEKLAVSQSIPVLIVWGERDAIIPVAHGRAAHELLPGSELVVFDGVGHEPHRGDPERFAAVLDDWCVRHEL